MVETIPGERLVHKSRAMISYYQWVPLILLFQALSVFMPCILWRFLNRRSGINMTAIMDAARVCSQAHFLEIREKVSKSYTQFTESTLHGWITTGSCEVFGYVNRAFLSFF